MKKLTTLSGIVQEVSRAPDLTRALNLIVEGVHEEMQVDVCSVYLTDHTRQQHLLMATVGLNPEAVGRVRLAIDEGLVGLVAQRSEPVNVKNAPSHPNYHYVPYCGEEPYHSFLGVPVMHQGQLFGVLVAQEVAERRFTGTEVAFLTTLAAQLAGGIALAQVRESVTGTHHLLASARPYIEGMPGATGVAIGTGVVIYSPSMLETVPDRPPEDIEAEVATFLAAVTDVKEELQRLGDELKGILNAEDGALFQALAMIAGSDSLIDPTLERIRGGNWAPGALRQTIDEHVWQFEAMKDPYLKERANDIRDIGRRLLARLIEVEHIDVVYPQQTILVGENLSAIDLAKVPAGRLIGVVCSKGSSLSHLAILARAMGIPAVVGIGESFPVNELSQKELIVDGYQGRLHIEPAVPVRRQFERLVREERELSKELQLLRDLPAESQDGVRIPLYTNAGLLSDLSQAQKVGAEGIGLYRTEMCFMTQERFPTEQEQYTIYRQVLKSFAPRPVTLRTLDVGGDKPLPYFPVQESNPYLGWRGIRISLDHPDIFLTQIRALMRASSGLGNLNLLLPMVNRIEDIDQALALIHKSHQQLNEEGTELPMPRCGAMLEVPSAIYQAEAISRRVDFLSVGTNDLTQYLLAADRNNAKIARWYDPLHPAVIGAIYQAIAAGKRHEKPVGVCGEAASDPAMALLLFGMGVSNLSLSAGALARIKWVIRSFTQKRARALLEMVLEVERAGEIREILTQALVDAGLGALVHPGK